MKLPPVVEVTYLLFIKRQLFHGAAMGLTGKEFWEFLHREALAGQYGIEDPDEAKIAQVQRQVVSEKMVDITKTKDTCKDRFARLFEEDFWSGHVVASSVADEASSICRIVVQKGTVAELDASLAACRDKGKSIASLLLMYPAGRDVWHAAHSHKEKLELCDKMFNILKHLAEESAEDKLLAEQFQEDRIEEISNFVEKCNNEFGALATSPASAEAEATLGPTFKKAYAKIFDNVLVVCRACLLKFVSGDAKQDAPLALRAAVEFFGKVNEWHQEPWATSSHKDQYIVLAKLLTGVPKLNKETNAEEVVSFIHDINNIAEMDVDTFLSVLPPGDDADSEAAAIRSFIL